MWNDAGAYDSGVLLETHHGLWWETLSQVGDGTGPPSVGATTRYGGWDDRTYYYHSGNYKGDTGDAVAFSIKVSTTRRDLQIHKSLPSCTEP